MWKTKRSNKVVIIGLPTIIKLLSGEEVKIEAQNLLLLPDDVLYNNRKRSEWIAAGEENEKEKAQEEKTQHAGDTVPSRGKPSKETTDET